MPFTASCPSAEHWKNFVLGCLSHEDIADMAEHLEKCPACVQTINTLQAEDTFTDALRQPIASIETLPSEVGLRLAQRRSENAATVAPTEDLAGDSPDLSFLAPRQADGELGRLGMYRVLGVLGTGGMGIVLEAEDTKLERRVALKVMLPRIAARATCRQRFLREARTAAALEHDNVVPIYQVGEENGVPFLAMSLLKGMSLDCRLKQDPPLSLDAIIEIGKQTASGLAAAHERGLIHRDIKPANLWLETSPQSRFGFRVRILDFGLARFGNDDSKLTQSGAIVGTPAYMAPEQARNDAVDVRADLFSLGCVLYRLLTGKLPFRGDNTMATLSALLLEQPQPPRDLDPNVPQALSDLVMRLLSKDANKRPDSAGQVVAALAEIAPSSAVPMSPQTRRHTPRRRPGAGWLVAAALLLVLLPLTLVYSGTILRFATNQGELIIDIKDPTVVVTIEQNKLKLHDKTTQRDFILDAGQGQVIVYEKNGLGPVTTKEFVLHRGGKTTVTVSASELAQGKTAAEKHIAEVPPEVNQRHVNVVDLGPVPAGKSPFDDLRREDIPQHELRQFGGASPVTPPPELVAILGDGRLSHWSGIGPGLIYSPNSDYLASYTSDGLRIWETATGVQKHWFACRGSRTQPFAFSHDSKQCTFTRADDAPESFRIYLADIESGQVTEVAEIENDPARSIHALAFTPDNKSLLAAKGSKVYRCNLHDKSQRVLLQEPDHPQLRFHFSGDGQRVVCALVNSPVKSAFAKVFDVATGKVVAEQSTPTVISSIHVDHAGSSVVLTDALNIGLLWHVETNELKQYLSSAENGDPTDCAFDPRGKFVASACYRSIQIHDVATRKLDRLIPYRENDLRMSGLAWSPDGKTLAAVSENAIIQYDTQSWTLKPPAPITPGMPGLRPGRIVGLSVAPDGRSMIAADRNGTVCTWNISKRLASTVQLKVRPDDFAVSPNHQYFAATGWGQLASGHWFHRLDIWDIPRRSELATQSLPSTAVGFTADSKFLIAGDKEANIIDLARPLAGATSVPYSKDGQFRPKFMAPFWKRGILTFGADSGSNNKPRCLIQDVDSGTSEPWDDLTIQTYGNLKPIASSPDGNFAALWTTPNELHLFDAEQKRVSKFTGGGNLFVAFSPNSKRLAFGDNNQINLADVSGKVLRTIKLRRPAEAAELRYANNFPAAFAPDGRHLVIGNPNGTIYVFRFAEASE